MALDTIIEARQMCEEEWPRSRSGRRLKAHKLKQLAKRLIITNSMPIVAFNIVANATTADAGSFDLLELVTMIVIQCCQSYSYSF